MVARNIKLVFSTNALILLCGVLTSLLSAWALGPAGRGDLLVVMLWPPVCAMLVTFGLTQAHRYWVAKDPECVSMLFSNAILFSLVIIISIQGYSVPIICCLFVFGPPLRYAWQRWRNRQHGDEAEPLF